jgi:hypothetical protein
MTQRLSPVVRATALAALLVSLVSFSAYAQFQTGNIYGVATSKEGAALPGVTVTLTGVGAPQSIVTDSQGNFRFINLSPGTYQLKAELSGFGSAVRTGIGVRVGSNADITMALNPSVAESITVTAEAPLLDTRQTGTGANISRVELEQIPTARDPWMILQSTPGVMVDRINVGGTQSGQQSQYVSKGAPRADGTWNIDGVNITDMGATGSSPTYYDFDMFEEMQITTGGSDPRIQTSGVQMNMVTKRGTNDIRGSGRYLYVPGSTSAEASVPTEAASYLLRTNRVNYVRDYGAEVGGPIWRDRAWLWLAAGDQKISTFQSQGFNAQNQPAFLIPDDTILRNKNFKGNAQLFTNNSFVAAYTYGDKYRNARDLSPTRPFEASWKQTGPTKVYKVEDTQLIGSTFYLTGMWSKVSGGFGLFANGGEGPEAPSYFIDANGVNNQNYFTYSTERPQKQYRIDGSKFLNLFNQNHEFKFGFGYRDTPVSSATTYPGPASGTWNYQLTAPASFNPDACGVGTPRADCGIATLYRPPLFSYSGKYNELYLGDTILLGNLTLQAGLRYDQQKSAIQAMTVGANPILATPLSLPCAASISASCTGPGGTLNAQLPGLTFPGQDQELEWTSISPRIGATYALGQDNKTLLRAAYNRYVSQMGATVSSSSPFGTSYFTFYGIDANRDRTIQRGELSRIRSFVGINPANPTFVGGTRRIDYNMNPPTTDEFLIGAERELLGNLSLGLTFTHRKYDDLPTVRFEKTQGAGDFYTSADYELVGRNAGGSFPDGSGGTITTGTVPVYQLKAGLLTPNFGVITNRSDYTQTFNGLELTATKRMANNWMMRFNASYNDYKDDCGSDAFANPTSGQNSTGIVNGVNTYGGPANCPGGQIAPQSAGSGAFGNVFLHAKWNTNINGLYLFPWNIALGANFMARQGYPAVLRETITGLRGGAYNAVAATPSGVVLDPIGEVRFDNVYQLDLRLAKEFRFFNRAGITFSGEVFNATNERTVLQRNTAVLQSSATAPSTPTSTAWRITELQAPRVWRMGAKITF